MAGKHTFIIEGKTRGVDKSKQKVKGLSGALGGLATKALAVGASYFAAKGLINGISSSLKLYAEQELAETKLRAALGKSIVGLQRYASGLQKVTRFGDELIMQGMAQLAFFIKDEKQLKIATKATLDLASAKGMDLVQAADLVAKSVGSSTNALSRYGIAADGAVGSEERLLSITNEIENLFGGQAEATTSSYQGAIDQLSNAFGDMQEKVGEAVAPAIKGLAQTFTDLLQVPLSDEMKNENAEFNTMLNTLKKLNPESKIRNQLIAEIQEKYGDYLGNLDLEKASLEDINKIQKQSNELFLAKITMQMREEEIKEARDKSSDAARRLIDADLELTRITDEHSKALQKGSSSTMGYGAAAGFASSNTAHLAITLHEAVMEQDSASRAFIESQENLEKLMSGEDEHIIKAEEIIRLNETRADSETNLYATIVEGISKADLAWEDYYNKNIASSAHLLEVERENAILSIEGTRQAAEKKDKINKKYNNLIKATKAEEVATLIGGLGAISKAIGGDAEITKALMISQAIASTYAGATKALAQGGMFGWGQAAMITAAGIANVKKIEAAQFGFSGVVDEPTMFLAGEAGTETVSVTPLEGPNLEGPQGGGSTIVINNPIISSDFAEEELPELIAEAVRRGVDFGMS